MATSYALLTHAVCDFLDIMKDSCRGRPEVGGILIGCYRGPHVEVTGQTKPGPKDRSTSTSFVRTDQQHQRSAIKAWHQSGRTKTYVGEWHSHPAGSPKPSHIDESTWRSVVQKLAEPCVFVIVSPTGWRLYRTCTTGKRQFTARMRLVEYGETGIVFE